MPVRVRFAPSPTGALHVGGIRTALFTWLLARHTDGTMILRIEDTDRVRFTPGSYEGILDGLRWVGLDWDEGPDVGGPFGPYVQSERLPLYHDAARRLVEQGDAYYCFCTQERLEALREAQRRAGKPTGYDRHCRNLDRSEVKARLAAGEPAVIRFAIPTDGKTVVHDAIRGDSTFDNAKLDDHILLKSDGFPTYHLSATLDDELMQITHVLRGEEWISSTPRHVLFHRAMGVEPPVYAQLPVVLGPDRKKLSKRNGDAAVADYKEAGYLPEALFNFLGTLGWSLDDKTTLISREQFIKHFDLDRVGSSPAMWDMKKLDWMNGEYIREIPDDELMRDVTEALEEHLPPEAPRPVDREVIAHALPELKTRLKRLTDAVPLMEYLFPEVMLSYEKEALLGKRFADDHDTAREVLELARQRLESLADWSKEEMETVSRAAAEQMGVKFGDFITPVRVAVTGRTVHLPIFVVMEILGKEETLRRLEQAALMLGTGA
jgi:glutamyl-tRNA synthetase